MADVERIIQIVFGATDSTGTAIKSVSKNLNQISSSISGMTDPLAKAHDRVLMLEAALGALAVGGLALAVNAAGEFDGQFREISTLIDATGEDVDKFREDIKAYAQDSTASIEDINGAVYSAISAGVSYQDAIASLGQAEKLAGAGRADLNDTTVALVSTMNAYGASAEEAERYSDVLFKTVKEGQTTLPELAGSLSQVTSIAASAGVPIETLAASIATLTAKGMPTEQAITAIKNVITSIISPSAEAAKAADSLGLQFNAAALQSKGLEGVLQEVYAATGGNVEQMSALFGNVRGLTGVLSAFGQDGGDMFLDKLKTMQDASGATAEAYEKMAGSFEMTNQNLLNNVRLTFIDLGENVLGSYADMVGGISEIFKALQESVRKGAFDDVFAVISDLADGLTDEFLAIAENLPEALNNVDFTKFVKAIQDLTGETGKLIENIFGADLSTAEGLEKAIQRVVNVVTILTNVTTGIIEGWQDWAVWLEKVIDYLDDTNGEAAKSVGNFLQFGKIVNELSGVVGSLGGALNALGNVLNILAAKQLLSLISSMKDAGGAIGIFTGQVSSLAGKAGLLGLAASVGYAAGTLLREWFPVIDKAAQKTLAFVDSLVDFTGQQEQAEKYTKNMAGAVQKYIENMDAFPDTLDDLRQKLSDMGKAVDDLPREVILQMAFDEGLVTPERLLKIAASARETAASADPVDIPVGFDESQYNLEMADVIDYAKVTAADADVVIEPEIKPPSIDDTVKAVDAMTEAIKPILQGFYETVQTGIEWEAKLNIAEVEANAKKVESIMESVGASATGAADVLSSIFGNIADLREIADRYTIQDWINEQIDIQKEALEIQKKTADAELALMEARRRRLESGDALIQVGTDGLQPEMEGMVWGLVRVLQTRITEEGLDMLTGL